MIACEWNPAAQGALHHNLQANGVASRCTILCGDCRLLAPKVSADLSDGLHPHCVI